MYCILQAKAKALEGLQDNDKAKRLTGKQWFMQDKNLAYKDQQEVRQVLVGPTHTIQIAVWAGLGLGPFSMDMVARRTIMPLNTF